MALKLCDADPDWFPGNHNMLGLQVWQGSKLLATEGIL